MASQEDPRVVELNQLREQLRAHESQLASLPAQRANAKSQQQQQQLSVDQRLSQIEFDRQAAQREVERQEAALRQQIASTQAQGDQLAAQQQALQRELERPEGRRSRPVEVIQQELDQAEDQAANLPAQRSALEAQAVGARAAAEEQVRQHDSAEAEAKRELAQANFGLQQQEAMLDAQVPQVETQIASLRQRIGELETQLEEEANQAENEKTLSERTQALEQELETLRTERGELAQLVEASRDVTSASAAEDLSEAYSNESARHSRAWKGALTALLTTVLLAAVGGALVIDAVRPEKGASNPEIATAVATQFLVIGLLIYLVRTRCAPVQRTPAPRGSRTE